MPAFLRPGRQYSACCQDSLIRRRSGTPLPLGELPTVTPKPVKTSEDMREMLRFDLDNENETIRNYRDRVSASALGEFATAEQIREILVNEQDHQIDLATALGEEVPDLTGSKPK